MLHRMYYKSKSKYSTSICNQTGQNRWIVQHFFLKYQCFSPLELLQFFHIPLDGSMAARDFLYMCPALIYQMDSGICSVSLNKNLENHSDVEIHYTVSGKGERMSDNNISANYTNY